MSSLPPLGTGYSDGLRAGPQKKAGKYTGVLGAPISPLFVYDIAPQPASVANIAPAAIIGAGTVLSVGAGLVNAGNSGTNTIEISGLNGQAIVMFDCDRAIQIAGDANATASTFTFYGIDSYGYLATKIMDGPIGAQIVTSPWTMSGVFRVFVSAPTTGNVSIGCADAFGLPYVAYSPNYLIPYFDGVMDNVTPPVLTGTSAALVAGVRAVNNPNVTASSLIFTSTNTVGTAAGLVSAAVATPGVSFSIVSSNATETSTVNYDIVTPSDTAGTAQLANVGGASQVTVYNPNILPTDSIRLGVQRFLPARGSGGTLSYVVGSDPILGPYFTVTSSNNADRSILIWQILRSSGDYAGTITLVGANNTVVPSQVVSTGALVFANYATNSTPGLLSQGAIVPKTSYAITSTTADASNVVVLLKNPTQIGQYILPDRTNPATITSGNPRGVYIPSSPSDGISRLTIWMYNRGILNANATFGANPSDPLFANTNANLYGVESYSDNNH